jgi:hypothetical protein
MIRASLLLLLAACTRSIEFDVEETGLPDPDGDGDGHLASEDCDDTPTWYGDADGDGFGGALSVEACTAPAGFLAEGGDCDDTNAAVFPGAEESCTETVDSNCDGSVGYADADGDGTPACEDCDDADASRSPDQLELCDTDDRDEDCDGAADDADPSVSPASRTTWYVDGDSDSYGSASSTVDTCEAPAGFVANAEDCDDADAADHPGAPETVGNDDDDDCDGGESCYTDGDGDGYRPAGTDTVASADADCTDPGEAGLAVDPTDCDDTNATVSPAGAEACNRVDDDCDGATDEGVGSSWYADVDGDGSGDASVSTTSCWAPAGYTASRDDCDDAEPLAAPTLAEVCGDGIDNDCAGDLGECTLDANQAADTAGYRLTGPTTGDQLGSALAVGDFDGDGVGDLSGGMYYYDVPASSAGAATVWYGPLGASGTATATGDALLTGSVSNSSSYVGYALSAGDHDGDGADELLVGAHGIAFGVGAAYLLYGGSRASSGEIASTPGVASFTGVAPADAFAYSVAAGRDLDGDGTEEFVVGAYGNDGAASAAGAAYLYYGSATRRSGVSAPGAEDAIIQGAAASAMLGYSVSFVSDMDGDGNDELLLGSYQNDSPGAAYLFLGGSVPLSGTMSASTADVTYTGVSASENAGMGVYDLTDVTDDGYGDAGVYGEGSGGNGSLYVYGGGALLSTAAVATLYGGSRSSDFGNDACSPGDLDGDGTNDLLVGSSGEAPFDETGAAALWYGPVSGSIPAFTADVVFTGATTGASFGQTLPDRAGDVTGDGTPDVIIGDDGDDVLATRDGAIYVWDGMGGE